MTALSLPRAARDAFALRNLPASAERSIDLDEGLELAEVCLGQGYLRREVSGIAVENLEVTGRAALVSHVRQLGGLSGRGGQLLELGSELLALPVTDERIRDVSKPLLHRLLVDPQRLVLLRLGERDAASNPPALE